MVAVHLVKSYCLPSDQRELLGTMVLVKFSMPVGVRLLDHCSFSAHVYQCPFSFTSAVCFTGRNKKRVSSNDVILQMLDNAVMTISVPYYAMSTSLLLRI